MEDLLSFTEENYLKALFKVSVANSSQDVGTNELASHLAVKPATANDMLKKLKEKKLVAYEKYGKIKLTITGKKRAVSVVRKHRLWETFLYEKLEFGWDEIHEIAEQLEHINSNKLIDNLDKFLGYPSFDPHGDPIPDNKGKLKTNFKKTLNVISIGDSCKVVAVIDDTSSFLQYVVKIGLKLHSIIKVLDRQEFDGTMEIEINKKKTIVSEKFAANIFVLCEQCIVEYEQSDNAGCCFS